MSKAKTKAAKETAEKKTPLTEEETAKETAEAAEETAENAEPSGEAAAEETKAADAGAEEDTAALLEEKDKKIAEQDDRFKRLFAEFDNFRKRSESEKAGMYAEGEKAVLEKILPLIDNFERALAGVPEELKGNAYTEGIEKIYRSFMDGMAAFGVTPIEAVGQPFDANLHNAVMHVEDEEAGENTVVEEFQKGYMFRDKVLRYSMVKVAN